MSQLKLAISAILFGEYGIPPTFAEPAVEQDTGDRDERAPWKIRLYGANKDRRASRKKRAKRLRR